MVIIIIVFFGLVLHDSPSLLIAAKGSYIGYLSNCTIFLWLLKFFVLLSSAALFL